MTDDQRSTPLGRAAAAIQAKIRRSINVELRPGMIGQVFGATMPQLARAAVSAALDVEEMARALCEAEPYAYHGPIPCDEHRRGAAAVRAKILGAS